MLSSFCSASPSGAWQTIAMLNPSVAARCRTTHKVSAAEHQECFPPPAPYAAALQDTIAHVSQMRAAMKSSLMDKESKQTVQNVIQVRM